MTEDRPAAEPIRLEAARCISVILPDDGTDRKLMTALLTAKGVTRTCSTSERAVGMLREAHTRRGRLPEPALARLVTIVVAERDADSIADFVCEIAGIGEPGGGMVVTARLLGATPFALPEGVPAEAGLLDEHT